jgi:LAO/AO transport system kinase
MDLARKVLAGDEKSAARLISMIEEGRDEGYAAVSFLFPHTGKAHVIGITGAPGAGKSTLINKLAMNFIDRGRKVGIIAVDPTSMKGDGALLGDRLRMKEAERAKGVFIRSMAHRGYPGGIAKATAGAVYVLDALGKEIIMVETVGAGQTELQISFLCGTVLSILTPDFGDQIQLMKAGLIEIGDIIAINKIDKPGAEGLALDVAAQVGQGKRADWSTPVVKIQAVKGQGIGELSDALDSHLVFLRENLDGESQRRAKLRGLLFALLKEEVWTSVLGAWRADGHLEGLTKGFENGEVDVYAAVKGIMETLFQENKADC